jgi:glycosyltransferase 2 family protein
MTEPHGAAANEQRAAAASDPRHGRKALLFAAKALLSAGLVVYLCSKLDARLPPASAWTALLLSVAMVLLLLQPVLIGVRWRGLLRAFDVDFPMRDAINVTWVSVFANQFLPSSIGGDAVRVIMCRNQNMSTSRALASVIFDRAFALLGLFLLIILLGPVLADPDQRFVAFTIVGALTGLGIAIAVVTTVAAPRVQQALAGTRLAPLAPLVAQYRTLMRDPALFGTALLLSIVVHLCSSGAFLAIAYCFGVALSPASLLALSALVTLAHILPISISGWGARDAVSVALFAAYGVDGGTALSISLLLGVGYTLASLPGAVLWLMARRA